MSHGDSVTAAPDGLRPCSPRPQVTPVAAFEDVDRGLAGVQWHPEVLHTEHGQKVLEHFLLDIAGCRPDLDDGQHRRGADRADPRPDRRPRPGHLRPLRRRRLRRRRRDRAARDRRPAHLRLRRPRADAQGRDRAGRARLRRRHRRRPQGRRRREAVPRGARRRHRPRGEAQDHRPRVHPRLRGRRGRGPRGRRAGDDGDKVAFLVQGTLYPDVVESGGGAGTSNIKSHHNVGGLPDDLEFELVEPLRTLFKDEVRLVGEQLGLPRRDRAGASRSPAPASASGSSARSPASGSTSCARPTRSPARSSPAAGLDRDIWQMPVVLLADVRSVGVQGDGRTYGHPVVLRPVTSEDAMTADWARLPVRRPRADLDPDHQRGPRDQPGHRRHHVEAAGHHRVGVTRPAPQPMCSIATRHTPSGSLRHTIVPRTSTLVGWVSAGPLTQDASTQTTARSSFPPYEAGGSTPIPTAAWTWPWRGGTHAPPPRARHLHRTLHPRCTRRPRRWGHPPRAQSPGVALLLDLGLVEHRFRIHGHPSIQA